ncbi:MAG: YceI family protein [Myxococcales bacterium]|nr:YceI family protein [Myxococcales bacterium]MCA9696062.1 YceI family protein [Myxococcales bacterium]
MPTLQRINTTAIVTLTALLALSACKSEIDDKPAAKTEEAAKIDDKGDKGEAADKGDAPAGEAKTLPLTVNGSRVGFIGAKVTADHKGSFEKFEGNATVEGDKLTGLEVTVEMKSMTTDAEKLTGHLLSPDFFDAENHPQAKFTSVSITEKAADGATHEVAGNLELRGKANKVTFPATIEVGSGEVVGKAAFSINRKEWGIDYAGMADDLIKDDVALELELHFPRG